jgi:hypothetical protein
MARLPGKEGDDYQDHNDPKRVCVHRVASGFKNIADA